MRFTGTVKKGQVLAADNYKRQIPAAATLPCGRRWKSLLLNLSAASD